MPKTKYLKTFILKKIGPILFWLLPLLGAYVFNDYQLLIAYMLVMGLFALSLDLILGYAGILSLGHALFFGLGGYAAGLLATHGWHEPLSGLLMAGVFSGFIGWLSSFLVLRVSQLAQLMVSLILGLVGYELANRMVWLTGGIDGLWGIRIDPIFGLWDFDFAGQTALYYCYTVLLICFYLCYRLVHSSFGFSLKAIRENAARVAFLGFENQRYLRRIYVVSTSLAGMAGALLVQITQFVALDSISFQRSAEVLMMLVLGGMGQLYGALIGAGVFVWLHDLLSVYSPAYWQFWLGLFLVAVVLLGRGGLFGWLRSGVK